MRLRDLENGGGPHILEKGVRCFVDVGGGMQEGPSWAIAVVEAYNGNDRTYRVILADRREIQVPADRMRAPTNVPWGPGTPVAYDSSSMGLLPAVILAFNHDDLTYNLDVRDHAAPDRIRPRTADQSGAHMLSEL